jgi:hypothetical protein
MSPFFVSAHLRFSVLALCESSCFGSWYVAGAKPVCMVLGLATGGMPVSVV